MSLEQAEKLLAEAEAMVDDELLQREIHELREFLAELTSQQATARTQN